MKKESFALALVFLLTLSVVIASIPSFESASIIPSNDDAVINIPTTAVKVAPGIFKLENTIENGRVIEGYAIIDYKKEHARPPWAGGNTNSGKTTCYSFISKGAKWKSNEPYILDSTNNASLNEAQIRDTVFYAIDEWEIESGNQDIFGNEINGTVDLANIGNLNGKNEIAFADINSPGAIAVTFVWGIFSGPPGGRELVEWDQVYDDVDFSWSHVGDPNAMDFENIVQHEMGHSFGLAHPDTTCTEETMYAFASFGETKKRSLNAGDIQGIINLY
ncbi:MAG: matrixin family metalloprotease [Nanoarchaeota archaeon]|nr:matrixin family metalloprotease [Nanoarchaeota archaeon]